MLRFLPTNDSIDFSWLFRIANVNGFKERKPMLVSHRSFAMPKSALVLFRNAQETEETFCRILYSRCIKRNAKRTGNAFRTCSLCCFAPTPVDRSSTHQRYSLFILYIYNIFNVINVNTHIAWKIDEQGTGKKEEIKIQNIRRKFCSKILPKISVNHGYYSGCLYFLQNRSINFRIFIVFFTILYLICS